MADQRESSMLFSLKGLFDLEQDRVAEERAARERQARVFAQEQAERERRAREALERRRVAEEHAARQGEILRREQEAALRARELATVERARAEAEARARLEQLELEQRHQRKLQELSEQGVARRGRQMALFGIGVALTTVLASAALYFGKLKPEAARLDDAYDRLVVVERERAEQAKTMLAKAEKKNRELVEKVATLQSELDAVHAAPAKPKPATAAPSAAPGTGKPEAAPKGTGKPCTDDGDPLNPCLK